MAGRYTLDYMKDLLQKAVELTRKESEDPQYRMRPECTANCVIDHLVYNIGIMFTEVGPDFDARDFKRFLDACGWNVKSHA